MGTQTKEGNLSKIYLAGIAEHSSIPEHGDCIGGRLYKEVEIVSGQRYFTLKGLFS